VSQASKKHRQAPPVADRRPGWNAEQAAAALRIIMFLWVIRRARWNVHRRGCKACSAWLPDQLAVPACETGAQLLAAVRTGREAIKILSERVDTDVPPEPALF
jgi:hypothetical protein